MTNQKEADKFAMTYFGAETVQVELVKAMAKAGFVRPAWDKPWDPKTAITVKGGGVWTDALYVECPDQEIRDRAAEWIAKWATRAMKEYNQRFGTSHKMPFVQVRDCGVKGQSNKIRVWESSGDSVSFG